MLVSKCGTQCINKQNLSFKEVYKKSGPIYLRNEDTAKWQGQVEF